jgi:hypothetical protein
LFETAEVSLVGVKEITPETISQNCSSPSFCRLDLASPKTLSAEKPSMTSIASALADEGALQNCIQLKHQQTQNLKDVVGSKQKLFNTAVICFHLVCYLFFQPTARFVFKKAIG